MNDLHAELLMRSMARDAAGHDPKNGQFTAGPGASAGNHEQHTKQAYYHGEMREFHGERSHMALPETGRAEHTNAAKAHQAARESHKAAAAAMLKKHPHGSVYSAGANARSREADKSTAHANQKSGDH